MSKINKLLWRPEHSRQELSSNDKNNLKEFKREEPELLMPNENNDLYNFNEKKEENELSTNINELIENDESNENESNEINEFDKIEESNEKENIRYVDQFGYEFEYVNEGDYDDNDSVYSDEDGNLIRYIDKGYKKVNKVNYKYIIIFILIILLLILLIKRFRN